MEEITISRLPGLMGRIHKSSMKVPSRNAVIQLDSTKTLAVKLGRPEALIVKNPFEIPGDFRPKETFDIAVVFEDSAVFYKGEYQKLVGVYKIVNGEGKWV